MLVYERNWRAPLQQPWKVFLIGKPRIENHRSRDLWALFVAKIDCWLLLGTRVNVPERILQFGWPPISLSRDLSWCVFRCGCCLIQLVTLPDTIPPYSLHKSSLPVIPVREAAAKLLLLLLVLSLVWNQKKRLLCAGIESAMKRRKRPIWRPFRGFT